MWIYIVIEMIEMLKNHNTMFDLYLIFFINNKYIIYIVTHMSYRFFFF